MRACKHLYNTHEARLPPDILQAINPDTRRASADQLKTRQQEELDILPDQRLYGRAAAAAALPGTDLGAGLMEIDDWSVRYGLGPRIESTPALDRAQDAIPDGLIDESGRLILYD